MDGLAQPHRGVRNPVIDLRTYILDPVEKFLEGEIGVKGRLVGQGSFLELYQTNRYFREIAEISNLDMGRVPAQTG